MSDLSQRVLAAVVTAALFGVIVVGLASAPPSPDDRVAALGARIRCPVCQNEAIADSPSETARQMLAIVEEKVAEGETDGEIEGFFVERYGEWVILDPPLSGRFALLWGLPVVAMGVGLVAIWRRRRAGAGRAEGEIVEAEIQQPEELRRHAALDLEELAEQVEAGEITVDVAARLRGVYQSEAERAEAAADQSRKDKVPSSDRSTRRVWAGWAIGLLASGVVVVMVSQAIEDPAAGIEPNGLGGRELTDVTDEEMEAVVAENPDVVPMRIALADRYWRAHDYEPALAHYLEVLKREPEEAEVWARVGWIVYQLGEPDVAAGYVERSLEIEAGLPEAVLYLGMIRFYGLDDPASALPLLQEVAARNDLPPDIREQVETAMGQAEAALENS